MLFFQQLAQYLWPTQTSNLDSSFKAPDVPQFLPKNSPAVEGFYLRVKTALDNLRLTNRVPDNLKEFILYKDLIGIYEFVLSSPIVLDKVRAGESFRIDKHLTGLARTLNVVSEPNGEMMLMLETKRKRANGQKDLKLLIGKGSYGTVKPSWRIDTLAPEAWVNKVICAEDTFDSDNEALLSQDLVKYMPQASEFLNVTYLGEEYNAQKSGFVKKSQYSKRAVGDLYKFLYKQGRVISNEQIDVFVLDMLQGLNLMHNQNKVHQDIKTENIFIYLGNDGHYHAKLADFGLTATIGNPDDDEALATPYYESPEISFAYQDPNSARHKIYHKDKDTRENSLGYKLYSHQIIKKPSKEVVDYYAKPHTANDMWALGIVIFELKYHRYPDYTAQDYKLIQNDPLLKGLLEPERSKRLSAAQALNLHMSLQAPAVEINQSATKKKRKLQRLVENNEDIPVATSKRQAVRNEGEKQCMQTRKRANKEGEESSKRQCVSPVFFTPSMKRNDKQNVKPTKTAYKRNNRKRYR